MKRAPVLLLAGCLVALVLGFSVLTLMRTEGGDVYPEYSSYRSDPLGTMALYESVDKLAGFRATRDLSASGELPDGTGITYLHLATTDRAWERISPGDLAKVETFVKSGARLIMTMYPISTRQPLREEIRKERAKAEKEEDESLPAKPVSLWKAWNLALRVIDLSKNDKGSFTPVPAGNVSGSKLPDALDWHSGVVFEKIGSEWKSVYERDGKPVVIERRLGAGSIVIATDSYFVSNEALEKARHADLLAWLIGSNRNVTFDEAHLGITEQPGMSALMRRYRLHGFIASLMLLAGLFIWKNATSLVPAITAETAEPYIAGRDTASGFVNLLRRNIAARDILKTCYTEWKKTAAQSSSYSAARLQRAEAAYNTETERAARSQNPAETYRAIAGILKKTKT